MRSALQLVLFGLLLLLLLCAYDIAWMKASDFGVLPHDLAPRYQLVKLLQYWIPVALCFSATLYYANRWAASCSGAKRALLALILLGYCLGMPVIAAGVIEIFGCFVYFTHFQPCK